MKFSYSAVWDSTMALVRAHGALIAAIAGVFLFLPGVLLGYFAPQPTTTDVNEIVPVLREYFVTNWHWFLLQALAGMAGTLAILYLVFAPAGTSVSAAIAAALALLPFYFLASLLSGIILVIGFILLILPGLYLVGRLAPLAPVMVAESLRNPFAAIGRTFGLTRGNGWRILGFILIVAIAALVAMMVVNLILGLIFTLVAGQDVGALLVVIVESATSAALATLFVLIYAALYRILTAGAAPAQASAAAD